MTTFPPTLRYGALGLSILAVLFLGSRIDLQPVARVLNSPVLGPAPDVQPIPEETMPAPQEIRAVAAEQVVVEHTLPEPAQTTNAPLPAEATPDLTEPEIDLSGDQDGVHLPALRLAKLSVGQVQVLLSQGRFTLWVGPSAANRMWFVPDAEADPTGSARGFYAKGVLIRDPAGLRPLIVAPDGQQLREQPFDLRSDFVPMPTLADLARRAGMLPVPQSGALRASPATESEMIAAQQTALSVLGLGPDPEAWPDGMEMQGCWTAQMRFVIHSARAANGTVWDLPDANCAI